MNTCILDTAIARLLSTNALVLTEPPHSQTVDQPELSRNGFETTSLQMNDHLTAAREAARYGTSEKIKTR